MKAIRASIFLTALAMAGVTAGMGCPKAQAGLEEGVAAYDRGDFATAIKEWQPEAEKGDRNALFNLGQVYRMGKGVPKDIDRAEQYYLEAAKLGHPAAQGNLGTLYYFGKAGGKPQLDEALKWWRLAAANNDPRSQYMLGVLYFNGKLVERNMVTAYGWMNLAAQSHLKEALDAERMMISFLKPQEIEAGKRLSSSLLKGAAMDASSQTAVVAASGKPTANGAAAAQAAIAPPKSAVAAKPSPSPASTPAPVPTPAKTVAPAPEPVAPTASAVASPDISPAAPTPAASSKTAAAPASDGAAYRVQLGAYKSRDVAMENWKKLQHAHGAILADVNPRVMDVDLGGAKGLLYRLQAGAFATSGEAAAFCKKIKAAKRDCMVVKAAE